MPSKLDPGEEARPQAGAFSREPTVYQIRIKGHLGHQWTDWFEGLTITLEDNGDTLLTGPVVDQAALHGLLRKVRDLGTPLVSVIQIRETRPYHSKKEKNEHKQKDRQNGRCESKTLNTVDSRNA